MSEERVGEWGDIGRLPDGTAPSAKTPDGVTAPVADAIKQTHPDFTIICDKCGSKNVIVENSLGYSALSGCWGSVDLSCQDCPNVTEIVSS